MRRVLLPLLVLTIVIGYSCSEDDPSKPSGGGSATHMAGGGRDAGDDPFSGGPEHSGPLNPGFEVPDAEFIPLFYADIDCRNAPGELLITNAEDWQAWWTAAIACLDPMYPRGGEPGAGHPFAGLGRLAFLRGDSGWVDPDTIPPAYPSEAPEVDFTAHAIAVISLAPDTTQGRGLWVTGIDAGESGSTIRYQVSRLGEDCFRGGIWPEDLLLLSPTIAVLIPGPVAEPVDWAREDIVFDCSWEPDPAEPLCIYYTDADCDLGAAEAVLRDRETFEAWLEQAFECDQARWYGGDSTVIIYPDGRSAPGDSGGTGGDTIIVPVEPLPWLGIDIDFTTHAVLVLRAGEQTRWGGGIWLDGIETGAAGTVIDYTVMVPSGECPEVEAGVLNPTVAIRVPLPLPEPVSWDRRVQTIDCRWDSSGAEPGTGTGPNPRGQYR